MPITLFYFQRHFILLQFIQLQLPCIMLIHILNDVIVHNIINYKTDPFNMQLMLYLNGQERELK